MMCALPSLQLGSKAPKEVDVAIVSVKDSALENMISGDFSWAGAQAQGAKMNVLLPRMTVPTCGHHTDSRGHQGVEGPIVGSLPLSI